MFPWTPASLIYDHQMTNDVVSNTDGVKILTGQTELVSLVMKVQTKFHVCIFNRKYINSSKRA